MLNFFKKPQPQPNLLAEMLRDDTGRRKFLGMDPATLPPTPDQQLQDARSVVNYARSQDYKVWAQDAWAKVVRYVDFLASATTVEGNGYKRPITQNEIDFARGALKATLDLLATSYTAEIAVKEIERRKQAGIRAPSAR